MRLAIVYDDAISKFSLTSAVQFCTVTIPNYKEEVNMPVRYTCSLSRTICEIAYYIISVTAYISHARLPRHATLPWTLAFLLLLRKQLQFGFLWKSHRAQTVTCFFLCSSIIKVDLCELFITFLGYCGHSFAKVDRCEVYTRFVGYRVPPCEPQSIYA